MAVFDPLHENGYNGVMNRANISYTRNHLSEMIARVREGESILIVDRQHPVARLEPVLRADDPNTRWQEDLARRGLIRSARSRIDPRALQSMPRATPEEQGDILDALRADREDGR